MTQRRTPSGQRPARRLTRPARGAGRIRGSIRESGIRAELRSTSTRTPGSSRGADAPRSASRPAAARRAAATGAAKRTSAPKQRRYTGRATVLATVLIALALSYTYPVRIYLNQQADIARIEAAQQAQRERIGKLSEEAALWEDPAYVEIKARERFYMRRPGETLLVVLPGATGAARAAGGTPASEENGTPEPWYDTLWSSIQAANEERRSS